MRIIKKAPKSKKEEKNRGKPNKHIRKKFL